jgi:hypothetical protein
MLGGSWGAAQLTAPQEGLSFVSKFVWDKLYWIFLTVFSFPSVQLRYFHLSDTLHIINWRRMIFRDDQWKCVPGSRYDSSIFFFRKSRTHRKENCASWLRIITVSKWCWLAGFGISSESESLLTEYLSLKIPQVFNGYRGLFPRE